MRVTILGMGNMGRGFAMRAIDRGHNVTVWNRTPGKAAEVVDAGAVEAATPAAAVGQAEVVLVVLADDTAVLDLSLGAAGVLAALAEDAVFSNVSTVSPDTARRLAEAGPPGRVLESPVMGSPAVVAQGQGRFLIGGPVATVERLAPLWNDLGAGYTHCGPPGTAATMKLMSNLLLITGVSAFAEAITTARSNGISDDLLRTVFADSPVVSLTTMLRMDAVMSAEHPGWFAPALARKDLRLAIELARRGGVRVRIGPAAEQLLTEVIDGGGQWTDFAAVIEALG